MNFEKAFSYVFDDQGWFNKTIIPMLVGLIPIIGGFVLLGYTLRTIKNVVDRVEYPLPVFDFGEDLGKGFKFFLISLLYALPAIVLSGLIALLAITLENNNGNWFAIITLIFVAVLLLFYAIFGILVSPVIQTNFAVKGTFSSAFAFNEIFGMLKNNIGAWLLVLVGGLLAALIAPLGSIAFGIGAVLTSMYSELMLAHLMGQAYNLSQPRVVVETPVS